LYPWNSSTDERKAIARSKRDEYVRLKAQWWDDLELQEDTWFKDQKSRIGTSFIILLIIEKDVHRTDRTISPFMEEDLPHPDPDSQYSGTNAHLEMLKDMLMTYNMYDKKKIGYVQGMSDLLSVIYAIIQDDSEAFWCFVGFMDRMVIPFKRN
jgi:TBC1 domain family member 15